MGTGSQLRQRLEELMPSTQTQTTTETSTTSSPPVEQYDDVVLTEEETAEALRQAREIKHYAAKRVDYIQGLSKPMIPREYTAREHLEFYIRTRDEKGELLAIDEDNKRAIYQLCLYFAGDSRFEGDLNKGILLQGPIGQGKTTMMRFFQRNQRMSYRIEPCQTMQQRFSTDGEEAIKAFFSNVPIAPNGNPFGQSEIGFCFDDLGTEGDGVFYGVRKNIMTEILSMRYSNKLKGISTHITTNLSLTAIKEQYGDRVADRMREMFNPIQFNAKAQSRRK